MISWILVFTIHSSMYPMNNPIVMDNFTEKEQCEIALDYIKTTYKQINVKGTGYCWGERK